MLFGGWRTFGPYTSSINSKCCGVALLRIAVRYLRNSLLVLDEKTAHLYGSAWVCGISFSNDLQMLSTNIASQYGNSVDTTFMSVAIPSSGSFFCPEAAFLARAAYIDAAMILDGVPFIAPDFKNATTFSLASSSICSLSS